MLRAGNGVARLLIGPFGHASDHVEVFEEAGASPQFQQTFFLESLILAQNERWQRGLGMQVEREAMFSILRKRFCSGQWRKGE